MNGENNDGLLGAMEKELKQAGGPMTCHDLFERATIKAHAKSSNRVSDYLGNMWRRGDVARVPAETSRNSRAQWAYVWKGHVPVKHTLSSIAEQAVFATAKVDAIRGHQHMEVTEHDGAVIITLANFTITVKPR